MINHIYITADTDEDGTEILSCQICGGLWYLRGDGKSSGEYAQSMSGEMATDCSDNHDQCHHYADECPTLPFTGTCSLDPDCNCLYCRS
jgi:hypothetical protein